jgi:hypothetical protein
VSPGEIDPGSTIADQRIRELYYKFLEAICEFHDDVKIETSRMDTKVYFGGAFLCRVVPYRQLFHILIGKETVWETRVRDYAGCVEAVDHALSRFLDTYSRRISAPPSPR